MFFYEKVKHFKTINSSKLVHGTKKMSIKITVEFSFELDEIIQKFILKNICVSTAKETIDKMKRQPTEWEKMSANDMTNKGLISKIYKQFIQLNIKKKPY